VLCSRAKIDIIKNVGDPLGLKKDMISVLNYRHEMYLFLVFFVFFIFLKNI